MTDTGQPDKRDAKAAAEAVRYRSMTLDFEPAKVSEKRADGTAETRIPIAISSEGKVERYDWWTDERYYEVLDHDAASVDLSYAKDGLPFLMDHDTRVQVGILEDVTVGDDRKVRGMLRMGNHPDAAWVEKDIRQGVRKKVSVGYRLGEYRIEKDEYEGLPVRRYRWKPMEGSSVPIPADYDVGVNRSADQKPEAIVIPVRFEIDEESRDAVQQAAEMLAKKQDAPAPRDAEESVAALVRPNPKERNVPENEKDGAAPEHKPGLVAVTLEEKRKEMADVARLAREHGMEEHLAGWFERGLSKDQVSSEILARKRETAPKPVSIPGHLGMSDREGLKFNFNRAAMNLVTKQWEEKGGFEKEVSDQIAKRSNRSTAGMFIPLDLPIMHRAAVTGNIAATSSLGGAGVQTSILSLIDLLRNKMLVRQLGATVLSGLTGNISFPRHIVANTMAWEGENPATAHANTAATLDNVTLSPKTAMASSAYSRQLLVQESFDVSSFVQGDLAKVLALGLDLAAIDGTGANNQPTGVMRQTGVTTITHGTTDGATPTWASLVSYETNVATNNADIGTMAWIFNPGSRGYMKGSLKSTTAGSTYLWADDNTVNGYRAEVTNQMPSNYTKGTSTTVASGVIFGVWSELLIGEWGGALEVIVDPYSLATQGMVQITQMLLADVAVRHPKSFAISKSMLTA